jgi:hypothetical protein
MGYVPAYTADELRGFALSYASEASKRNISQIVNGVWNDVLRRAKSGYFSSTTDITSGRYPPAEIQNSITELQTIFPSPTTVELVEESYTQKIVVTWPSS